MINHIKGLLIFVGLGISLLAPIDSNAQTRQTLAKHNWYFGNTQRAIRFNRVTNVASLVTNKAVPFGTGGSAVATDRGTGNLLFYTDGEVIYDANHEVMPGGNALNANTNINQPVAITPVPRHPGKYFVFTNNGDISYTIVDMNEFGNADFPSPPFGEVESLNNTIPSLTGVSEGMITLPHQNGEDFWLITQNANSQIINATLITQLSYGATPIFNTVASTIFPQPTSVAHFAYHEGLGKIACAPQDPSTDAVILDFLDDTGAVDFDRFVYNSGVLSTTTEAIYDIEWSASGNFLYLSRHGETGPPVIQGNVFQYDYLNSSPAPSPVITLAPVLPAPVFRSYGLQRGPDNMIYHLYQGAAGGPFLLGRIDHPDSVAEDAGYTTSPPGFAGLNFDGKQFPNFVPRDTVIFNLDFSFAGTCQNSPTTFFPFVRPGADSLQWDFGDDNTTSAWSPIHTYEEAGTYNVVLRAWYQGISDEVSKPVTIRTFALTLQMTTDTTACKEEFPPPRGSSSPTQFQVTVNVQGGTPQSIVWSNGDLGATLTPDSAGYYYVVVTDAGGCSAYAGVNVKEYGLNTTQFNKWYFGNKAGIDFTTGEALAESVMDAPEGCAIACDRNGQQIFYTDGSTVYNKNHAVIATDIGGNPQASQSAIIIPVPGDETIYYIFTTQDFNGSDSLQLNYSMFDLKENAGTGAVVKQEVLLYMKNTERITANGQWLIVHELGSSTFRSYPISADGIGNQVFSEAGTIHNAAIPANSAGYMKLGPRDVVAVPISTPGESARIEIFHLNDTTGMLNNYHNIDLNDPNGTVYGIEFSPAGGKLYASVRYAGGASAIYEYAVDSLLNTTFVQRIPVAADIGAIQIAPDGQIYVAVNSGGNNTSLGTIAPVDDEDDPTQPSSFLLGAFPLAGGTNSRLGLPNLIQQNTSASGGPGITVTGLCASDSTRFSGSPRDQIDSFNWSIFRNGDLVASSTEATFALLLPAGDYQANLTLSNRCDANLVLSRNFTVHPAPFNPTRGVPLCNTPSVDLDANPNNVPGMTFDWSTGATTEVITVDEQGIYQVDITDANGCTVTGQFLTADSRPLFDLGPDITICQGNNTPALNVQNPGMTIEWSIDGATIPNTSPVQAVNTDNPGIFVYEVTVTDPLTNCFRTEDKAYTINVSPLIRMDGTDPTGACGSANGTVNLHIDPSAAGPLYSFLLFGQGFSDDGFDVGEGTTFTLSNVVAGTYNGVVTDQVSGCTSQESFGLSDAPFTADATVVGPNCDPVTLEVAITSGAPGFPLNWTTTNEDTGDTETGVAGGDPFNLTPLPEGDYVIELRDNGNCTLTINETVAPNPELPVTLTPDLCALTIDATATGALTYAWTATPASGIVGATNGASIQMAPNAGTVTYGVTVTAAGSCPGTEEVTLNVSTVPTPTLSQTPGCTDFATISVDPNGTFTYRWTRNGAPDIGLGGSTIQLSTADNGDTFTVQIFETQTGCVRSSAPLTAEVVGVVDATLTSTPPCDDGQPVTLTAETTNPADAVYAWSLNGTTLGGVTTPTTDQMEEGTYTVVVSKGSCSATSSLAINRNPIPVGDLPNSATICDDPENDDENTRQVALDPGMFVEYEWLKNGVTTGVTDRIFNADTKGTYEVIIFDANRCRNTDKTEVINDCLPKINAPNAFKPASDVVNEQRPELGNKDFWIFSRFIDEEDFKVFIFNRWGEMVYSSTDRFFKWNGGYNNDIGRPLPPGTYSYVLQYIGSYRRNEGVKEKRGGVALIR